MYLFPCTRDNSFVSKVFEDVKIVRIHALYVYDLTKIACKSVKNLSTSAFSKSFFELNSSPKCTKGFQLLNSTISSKQSSFHSFLLNHRGSKVLNVLSRKCLLLNNFGSMKNGEVTDFVHTFRDLFILSNIYLVKVVLQDKNVTLVMADACG